VQRGYRSGAKPGGPEGTADPALPDCHDDAGALVT